MALESADIGAAMARFGAKKVNSAANQGLFRYSDYFRKKLTNTSVSRQFSF